MALPANITTIDVRMKYVDILGNATTGTVSFTPSTSLNDPAVGTIILANTVTATLTNGTSTITLPVTDDNDANPTGFTYQVIENMPGGRTYNISLPSTLGTSINLADITPTQLSVGNNPYATVAQYQDISNRLTQLDGTATALATYATSATTAANAANAASAAASAASISVATTYAHPFLLMGI